MTEDLDYLYGLIPVERISYYQRIYRAIRTLSPWLSLQVTEGIKMKISAKILKELKSCQDDLEHKGCQKGK